MRVIDVCIDGVCWYTDVRHIEESTPSIAHSVFH
jgi:hypothetical protein